MKTKILIILAVAIFSIVAGIAVSFAAEARAYATVIIIIPPRHKPASAEVMPATNVKAEEREEKSSSEASKEEGITLAQSQNAEVKSSE